MPFLLCKLRTRTYPLNQVELPEHVFSISLVSLEVTSLKSARTYHMQSNCRHPPREQSGVFQVRRQTRPGTGKSRKSCPPPGISLPILNYIFNIIFSTCLTFIFNLYFLKSKILKEFAAKPGLQPNEG